MFKNKNTLQYCLLVSGLYLSSLAYAAPDLIVGSGSTTPDALQPISIPLTFTNNASVAGIQLEITFDSTLLTAGQPTLDALLNAGFRVSSYNNNAGLLQLVIVPPITNPVINSGDVINIPFSMTTDESNTILSSIPLTVTQTVTQTVMSDANANPVYPTVLDGVIIYTGNTTSDTDADGIPDYYEITHNLLPTDPSDALLDPDLDTLTNLKEFQLGTNPQSADTDADGLPDNYEYSYGLNPIVLNDATADFDGDGIADIDEYNNDTDVSGATDNPLQNLTAKAGNKHLLLSWDNAPGTTVTYNIYWSNNPGVTKATGNKITDVTNPYDHTGLVNRTDYYYVVTAVNTFGESPKSTELKTRPDDFAWLIPIFNLLLD